MNIVVVESPAKAKTINQYLGKDYKVIASYGHIRDLPNKNGSVLPEKDFAIIYKVNSDKKKQINEINNSISRGDILWLATDADREGEAIAWHIQSILSEQDKLKGIEVKRVIFNEITKSAILKAFDNPKTIDLNMVNAYQARRALDYLMGFTLSPVLWKALPRSKSAGIVQSVALKLICERETDIEAFNSQEYWTIETIFKTPKNKDFIANLYAINKKKLEKLQIKNETEANNILDQIKLKQFEIEEINKKRVKQNPAPPFITSTLQQEAYRKLGYSAKYTMSIAQSLYEGIDIKGETIGLITYMRTDSINLSDTAIKDNKKVIENLYGNNYVVKFNRKYKNKSKNAQEAHEAIRPTDCSKLPNQIGVFMTESQKRLYELIWKRTIASQMSSAEIDQLSVTILSTNKEYELRASGSTIVFDGFKKIYTEGNDEKDAANNIKESTLPILNENDHIEYISSEKIQHFTQPPPRFTEASLVKKLEELGIGRPSTYANIVSVIQEKGYVKYEKKRFIPESKGRLVTSFLSGYFKQYIENNFTANLELQLDNISDGKNEWKHVLKEWWLPYKEAINSASSLRVKEVVERIDNDLGPHFFPEKENGENPRKCPKCDNGNLRIQYGRFGGYIGCSNYPECKFNTQLLVGGKDIENTQEPIILGENEDNKEISLRNGPYGPYIQLGVNSKTYKPKRVTLPKNIDPNNVTLELARNFLSLPRNIGSHPETGKMITAQIGRFGPYVKHENISASIPKNEDIFEIGINRAVDLIIQKQEKPISKYRSFRKKKR